MTTNKLARMIDTFVMDLNHNHAFVVKEKSFEFEDGYTPKRMRVVEINKLSARLRQLVTDIRIADIRDGNDQESTCET